MLLNGCSQSKHEKESSENENKNNMNQQNGEQDLYSKAVVEGNNSAYRNYAKRESKIIDAKQTNTETQTKQTKNLTYKRMKQNDFFGQISLCLKQLSQNIIQCTSKHVTCLAIPKETFNSTFKFYFNYNIEQDLEFLQENVYFFKDWNKNLLKRVVLFGQKVSTKRGNVIFQEGEVGDSIYLVMKGEFSAYKQYIYAPQFFVKSELNDIDRIRADKAKEMDSIKQHKSLKILVLGVGELFGENELFLSDIPKRCFSVQTESQEGLLIRIHYEIFEDIILADLITKKNIINLHEQRMKFIEEKIQKQRQQLTQYLDFFFENKQNLEMKKKSTDFIKNSLKSIDQLNRDSVNKFLQNAYQQKSPQKLQQTNYPQTYSQSANNVNHQTPQQLSVPTLNYIISDKQNDVVTESDFKSQQLSNKPKSHSNVEKSAKDPKDISAMFKAAKFSRLKNTKQQKSTIQDPMIQSNQTKKQKSQKKVKKNMLTKESLSPTRNNLSRQGSQMIQRLSEIHDINERQTNLNSPQSTFLKLENISPSLAFIPRTLSHNQFSNHQDNKNSILLNGTKVHQTNETLLSLNTVRKHKQELVLRQSEPKPEQLAQHLSPTLFNRKIISQSTHQLHDSKQSLHDSPAQKAKDNQEGQKQKQLVFLFKHSNHQKQAESDTPSCNLSKINPNNPQVSIPSRYSSCLSHFRAKSSTNMSSSYMNEQVQLPHDHLGSFANSNIMVSNNHADDNYLINHQIMHKTQHLTTPIELQELQTEENPLVQYTTTGNSSKNNKSNSRKSVQNNFNQIFENNDYFDENNSKFNKLEYVKKQITESNQTPPSKSIIGNNSAVIMKQGVKMSYYKTNSLTKSTNKFGEQKSNSQNRQTNRNLYQLNNYTNTPSTPERNIHYSHSKSKSSLEVFEKILRSKRNMSPFQPNHQNVSSGIGPQIVNPQHTLFQNQVINYSLNEY